MNYLADAALFLLLCVALVAFGWSVSGREKSSLESALLPGAAFLGVYAFAIWAIGSLWRLDFSVFSAAALGFLVIAWQRETVAFHARRFFASLGALSRGDKILSLYLCALFALTFFLSLAPPSSGDYDSLTYHLAAPAHYLRIGKIVELPFDHHTYFPFTLEMLFMAGLEFRGAVFAKLFHWLMLPLGALALAAIGKRAHSARAGLLAACLYASMPLVLQEATTAYIDLGFAAFAFLAVLCFCGAPSQNKGESWIWCGVFCGFCIGTKYFGWLIFGFLGLWFLISSLKNRRLCAPDLARFALPALVFGAPWYLRNVFWTGNPVYPFAFGAFGGEGWTSQMARDYEVSQAFYGFGTSLPDLVMLPWRLAMTPLNIGVFEAKLVGQPFWPLLDSPLQNGQYGFFDVPILDVVFTIFPGPAIIALGFLALLGRPKPRAIGLAAWFFGFLWIFWVVTSQQIRYLLPALGLLALVGGWGAAHFAPRFRFARWVGGVGLALWFLLSPALIGWRARANFPVLSGAISGEDYLRRSFAGYSAMDFANQQTPKTAKFAVFGEPRCFYLQRHYFWADDAHNNLLDFAAMKTGVDFAREMRKLGTTHVLWNTEPGNNGGVFGPPQPLMDEAIAREKLILQFEARGYRIYRIVD